MRLPRFICVLAVAVVLASAITSVVAYRAGKRQALALQKGTLVGTLAALDQLRRGDVTGGTQRIEALCFMSGVVLMADAHYHSDFVVRTFKPSLIAYRRVYRTNRAEWTPTEQRLEGLLTSEP